MEKLTYLLWKPSALPSSHWHERLRDPLLASLRAAGAQRFRLNLADEAVLPATNMRLSQLAPSADAVLSFWLDSASQSPPAEELLAGHCERLAGYSVCESEPLPNTRHPAAEGERVYGMNHIVLLQIPPRLTREQWLELWLQQHTPIAIDTQETFGYRQNIVVRALTPDAPQIDAIVEENFPPDAMTDQNAFYRRNSPEELASNQKQMYASCKRFIDFDKMDRLPTSEYNFK